MPKSRESTRRPSKRLRCAIYTRKSSDEGLEQALQFARRTARSLRSVRSFPEARRVVGLADLI